MKYEINGLADFSPVNFLNEERDEKVVPFLLNTILFFDGCELLGFLNEFIHIGGFHW